MWNFIFDFQEYLLHVTKDAARAIADILNGPGRCMPSHLTGTADFFTVDGKEYFCYPPSMDTMEYFYAKPKEETPDSIFVQVINGKITLYNIFIQISYNIHAS